MATIKEVSELAQVSSATVSRVINSPDSVKAATRKRVLDAINTLGYRHNALAASLASKKTNTVGYLVPELHGSFFGTMMSGTEAILRRANKHMIVATGHSDEATERAEIETLMSRRCDALILHVEGLSDDYLIELANQGNDFVLVNRYIKEIGSRCIALDNKLGGYLATRSLIELGHTDIAYVAGSLWKADGRDRLNGHIQALQEAGLAFDPRLMVEGDFQADSGFQAALKLCAQSLKFSAIVCANDEMAAGALDGLRQNGLQVPDDVSLIGFDNVEFGRFVYPKLTTIDYPTQRIGEMAARWVLSTVYENASVEIEHILKPTLIERDSCRSHDSTATM